MTRYGTRYYARYARYYATDPTELGLSVSAMVWRGHEILLMRRSDNGHWGLPGALSRWVNRYRMRREVYEETGWSIEQGEPTTPEETLEMGFFAADSLPSPFVPIHTVRVEDGLAGRVEAVVR